MRGDMWDVTGDTWQVTCDTKQVTHDRWHMTHGEGCTFSPNFSSLALTVWDLWCFEDLEEKYEWMTKLYVECEEEDKI